MKNHATIFSIKELSILIKNAYPNGIKDIPNVEEKIRAIENWQKGLIDRRFIVAKEEEIKPLFVREFFEKILGYSFHQTDSWNLQLENKTSFDTTKADVALGYFQMENSEIQKDVRVVVEIKDARTTLDKPQNRKDFRGTSVEQAFMYAAKSGEKCKWVLVSNFLEIRLYLANDMTRYESFDILALHQTQEFLRFYYLLSFRQLFLKSNPSMIDTLLENRQAKEEKITKEFYQHYKYLREIFYYHLKKHNPAIPALDVLFYAQTIIDRVLFVSVIKDYGLIDLNTLKRIENIAVESWAGDKEELWRQLKYFFKALDEGMPSRIHQFNGGLFRHDERLNQLVIKDFCLRKVLSINNYDFESDLNINILGHIFEQSIQDIEILKKEIASNEEVNYTENEEEIIYKPTHSSLNKRKKEGIFYTPEKITSYIIENTVGEWLNEKKEELGILSLSQYPEKEQDRKIQIEVWEKYKEILKNVKVLDPACGSGAFLTQAFDYLLKEWQIVIDVLQKLYDKKLTSKLLGLFESSLNDEQQVINKIKKHIVNHNLYGVDLNQESVEITKLGLWLKSASKKDPLALLDTNIKCGNSLIEDVSISEKAFEWNKHFDFQFDIVVGNPPYFNVDTLGAGSPYMSYLQKNYAEIWQDKSDILFYFLKKAIDLTHSKVGFIISNAFLFSDKAQKLRNYLLEHTAITKIINFEELMVFEDASITTTIIFLDKKKTYTNTSAVVVKGSEWTLEEVALYISDKQNAFSIKLKINQVFALVNEKIANLNQKIDDKGKPISDVCHLGKGMETAADDVFSFKTYPKQFPKEFIKKRASGVNTERFLITEEGLEYILYFEEVDNFEDLPSSIQEHLLKNKEVLENRATVKNEGRVWWRYSRPMHKELYNLPKIFCSRRAFENTFAFDKGFEYLCFSNMTVIFQTNPDIRIEYILALLNSKVLNFRYKSIGKQTGNKSFEYFPNGVGKLPIPMISLREQEPFIQKSQELMTLKQSLYKAKNDFISLLENNIPEQNKAYSLKKIPIWYELSTKEFLKELEKQNIQIPLKKQKDLFEFFETEKNNAQNLVEEINLLEKSLNSMIYQLFQLSEVEILQIENT
jgi:hypothetical protein